MMLKIKNLSAVYDNQMIIENVSLEVKRNHFHLILGDSSSGGNALMQLLAGNSAIEPSSGSILLDNQKYDLLTTDQRSRAGVFTISVNIPHLEGVQHYDFCKKIFKIHYPTSTDSEFTTYLRECYELLDLPQEYDTQEINDIKNTTFDHIRTNLLLMMMSNPKLILLEDIDATLNKAEQEFIVQILQSYIKDQKRACLIFTQDQNFAKMLPVTHVSLMSSGLIRKKGSKNILERIIKDEHS